MADFHSGENGLLVQLQHVRESNREKEVVMTLYQKMTGNIVQVLLKKREHAAFVLPFQLRITEGISC